MKILVRLPNWLGDMVMSIPFINALKQVYPDAVISVIAKKGIHSLLDFFPPGIEHRFIFSKEEYPGIKGTWKFGRMIRSRERFDLFFSLPDSFSSALVGFASGAKNRIGYKKEMRQLLLTHSYKKQGSEHRVLEYIGLLSAYAGKKIIPEPALFTLPPADTKEQIVVNINSEASSRRLPFNKAIELLANLRANTGEELVLVGGRADIGFVQSVVDALPDKSRIVNMTGKTSLEELIYLIAASKAVLTTDSGPAHVANATGVPTVVLFGAGNENSTSPYNKNGLSIIRLGQLPCEPCVKNNCALYGVPKCMELLDNKWIINEVVKLSHRASLHL